MRKNDIEYNGFGLLDIYCLYKSSLIYLMTE